MSESQSSRGRAPEPRQSAGAAQEKAHREKVQQQLDEALADSFPASDPVSIVTSHAEEDWGQPESK
ncbi:MAG: hypothetical protein ACRET5_19075 [Steroidobacteraceae bacterium]